MNKKRTGLPRISKLVLLDIYGTLPNEGGIAGRLAKTFLQKLATKKSRRALKYYSRLFQAGIPENKANLKLEARGKFYPNSKPRFRDVSVLANSPLLSNGDKQHRLHSSPKTPKKFGTEAHGFSNPGHSGFSLTELLVQHGTSRTQPAIFRFHS